MADGVGDRAFGGLGGILAMNINAHAHFGNTAHACHRIFAFVGVRGKSISSASFAPGRSKRKPPKSATERLRATLVPANAGTHTPRQSLLQKVSNVNTLTDRSRRMGPGSRPGRQ